MSGETGLIPNLLENSEQRANRLLQEWRDKNREHVRAQGRRYYHKHKLKRLASKKIYRQNNREKEAASLKAWKIKNREHIRAYYRKRYKENIDHQLRSRLASRIVRLLKRKSAYKSNTTLKLLGCSLGELKAHIQSLFQPGMSWENRHLWHIDHVRPCSSFNLLEPQQQKECFHYTNLQPLWSEQNLQKSDIWLTEEVILEMKMNQMNAPQPN